MSIVPTKESDLLGLYSKQDSCTCVHINTARLPSAGTVRYSLSGSFGSSAYLHAWTADQHVGLHLTADQLQMLRG